MCFVFNSHILRLWKGLTRSFIIFSLMITNVIFCTCQTYLSVILSNITEIKLICHQLLKIHCKHCIGTIQYVQRRRVQISSRPDLSRQDSLAVPGPGRTRPHPLHVPVGEALPVILYESNTSGSERRSL